MPSQSSLHLGFGKYNTLPIIPSTKNKEKLNNSLTEPNPPVSRFFHVQEVNTPSVQNPGVPNANKVPTMHYFPKNEDNNAEKLSSTLNKVIQVLNTQVRNTINTLSDRYVRKELGYDKFKPKVEKLKNEFNDFINNPKIKKSITEEAAKNLANDLNQFVEAKLIGIFKPRFEEHINLFSRQYTNNSWNYSQFMGKVISIRAKYTTSVTKLKETGLITEEAAETLVSHFNQLVEDKLVGIFSSGFKEEINTLLHNYTNKLCSYNTFMGKVISIRAKYTTSVTKLKETGLITEEAAETLVSHFNQFVEDKLVGIFNSGFKEEINTLLHNYTNNACDFNTFMGKVISIRAEYTRHVTKLKENGLITEEAAKNLANDFNQFVEDKLVEIFKSRFEERIERLYKEYVKKAGDYNLFASMAILIRVEYKNRIGQLKENGLITKNQGRELSIHLNKLIANQLKDKLNQYKDVIVHLYNSKVWNYTQVKNELNKFRLKYNGDIENFKNQGLFTEGEVKNLQASLDEFVKNVLKLTGNKSNAGAEESEDVVKQSLQAIHFPPLLLLETNQNTRVNDEIVNEERLEVFSPDAPSLEPDPQQINLTTKINNKPPEPQQSQANNTRSKSTGLFSNFFSGISSMFKSFRAFIINIKFFSIRR
ncbi:MAG: hypothetical protein KBD37_00375 [Burkholderiales bacterium]|nr:hypothetical protein [Burkholderiales bacterium]